MNNPYIAIFVNGEVFNCYKAMSLSNLIEYFDFNINNIVVEYNEEIITNDKFSDIVFNNQDKVEIVTIVGGG
nr:thiamine biosynthesis protein S [Gloiopeltis furcata]